MVSGFSAGRRLGFWIFLGLAIFAVPPVEAQETSVALSALSATGATAPSHPVPNAFWSMPFALLLLAIAILPLIPATNHWWESHHHKLLVGLALGAVVLGYYAFRGYGFHGHSPGWPTVRAVAEHAVLEDYFPFMALLFSLYVISGG